MIDRAIALLRQGWTIQAVERLLGVTWRELKELAR
jgi:hypothetical protein